jgi:ATP synthase F1 delta subunit
MSDRDEFGAFLVGFVVGGLTGAVVALLFAPQSGEETRALIKDKSIELRDRASQSAEEVLARAEAAAAEARTRAEELTKEAKQQFASALEKSLSKKVHMNVTVDKSLIGGVLVRAGDRVIDGSIRGQLQQMQKALL